MTSGGWERSHEPAVSTELASPVSIQAGFREWPAVVVIDAAGVVTYWSPGAERLYGWTSDEAFGRPIYERNIDAVDAAMTAFTGGAQADDVAMLALVAAGSPQ